MSDDVNTKTGEVEVPTEVETSLTLGSSMQVMSPEQAGKAVAYLEEVKKSILKQGVDYGVIPGTGKKPTLFKPGAQKLCAFFGLAAHYSTEAADERPMDVWHYEDKNGNNVNITGYFSYRMRCELQHKETGVVWGTGIGNCNNMEKGRQKNDANTILKMAQKRALLQATLDATFSSELFTQDLEGHSGGQSGGKATEKQMKFIGVLVDKRLMPDNVSISAENLLSKPELQTIANAKQLIDKLLKCVEK